MNAIQCSQSHRVEKSGGQIFSIDEPQHSRILDSRQRNGSGHDDRLPDQKPKRIGSRLQESNQIIHVSKSNFNSSKVVSTAKQTANFENVNMINAVGDAAPCDRSGTTGSPRKQI